MEYFGGIIFLIKANLYVQMWKYLQTYFIEKYVIEQCKYYT